MACEICKKPYVPSVDDNSLDPDKKPHVCNICGKSFSLKIQLKRHLLSHEGNVPYICNTCEKHLDDTSYNLRLSKKGSFTCDTCKKCFTTKRLLLRHASEHTLENVLVCDDCGECFKNATALKKHAVIHKPKKSVSKNHTRKTVVTSYQCQDCGVSFCQLQQYEAHCLTHKKYQCVTCEIYFASDKLLEEHQEWCDRKPKFLNNYSSDIPSKDIDNLNADDKKHTCSICDKSFTRKSALEGHLVSHYEENRESTVEDDSDKDADFQCNYKEGKFCEQSKRMCLPKLKIRRSFPCEKCGFVCASKKSFDKHMLSHEIVSDEHIILDEHASHKSLHDKLLSDETNQTSHGNEMAVEKKTYECRICKEIFESKENYKKHKLSHRKELEHCSKEKEVKLYTCQICLKVFSKKKHFKKHVAVHLNGNDTNEMSSLSSEEFQARKKHKRTKKYSCSICGKLFAGETCLKKHEAKHADEKDDSFSKGRKGKKPKTLICEYCNEDFTGRRHIYIKHKLSHTPEVCGICDARFVDRASLREHCRVHIGTEEGRRFLECSQKALDAKNGVVHPEPKVEYIYLVLR